MGTSRRYLVFCVVLFAALCTAPVSAPSLSRDEAIQGAIQHSAEQLPKMQGAVVRIAVESGNVVLLGTVRLYIQKMEYERIAWTTEGVKEVESEIRVVPNVPVLDSAIEKHIRAIVNTNARFRTAELTLLVAGGSVLLDATFDHPDDVLFLKHRVAEIEGVTAIVIKSTFRV